jgi:hypothetical protein
MKKGRKIKMKMGKEDEKIKGLLEGGKFKVREFSFIGKLAEN